MCNLYTDPWDTCPWACLYGVTSEVSDKDKGGSSLGCFVGGVFSVEPTSHTIVSVHRTPHILVQQPRTLLVLVSNNDVPCKAFVSR